MAQTGPIEERELCSVVQSKHNEFKNRGGNEVCSVFDTMASQADTKSSIYSASPDEIEDLVAASGDQSYENVVNLGLEVVDLNKSDLANMLHYEHPEQWFDIRDVFDDEFPL